MRLFRAINALLDNGHTVHYLAVVPFPIDHPNCYFHRFPWPSKYTTGYIFWGIFHIFAPLQLFFLGVRYRVNRLFAFGYNYSLFMQPLRLLKRIPLTVFLRADTIENHRIIGRSKILIRFERFLEGLGIAGSRMYGVSESLTNKTLAQHKYFKPAQSGVLRNDIIVSPCLGKKTKMTQLPLRLACVGVLEPRKNQKLLLGMMKGVNAKHAQLYLYGVGPDEGVLKEIVKKEKITDRVHFMGWLSAEKIWPEIDLLLMPSLHEGAPNSILEALGYSVPVLASDIPEHAEILPSIDLLPVNQSREWGEFIDQKRSVLHDKLQEIAKRQSASCEKLSFNWENKFIELVNK